MTRSKISSEGFPTFSIVMETENLSTAAIEGLSLSLASLAAQDYSVENAREVVLVNSGDVAQDVLDGLLQTFPWLSVYTLDDDVGYYHSKMAGLAQTTGDAVLFFDSDCQYEPSVLRHLLRALADHPNAAAVTGETTTAVSSVKGMAMAMAFVFSRFTHRTAPFQVLGYRANNVAFRREVLERMPIPDGLPVYRKNCEWHAHQLREAAYQIVAEPRARSIHALPTGGAVIFWRFLLMGHDALTFDRLLRSATPGQRPTRIRDLAACLRLSAGRLKGVTHETWATLREDPRRLRYLPFALPLATAWTALYLAGLGITYAAPSWLLHHAEK